MKVGVIGTGSFGTALAQILVRNNHEVVLWGRNMSEVNDINDNHKNSLYFEDYLLDERLKATSDFSKLKDSEMILLAIPSIAIEEVCHNLNEILDHKVIIINVAKGFHPVTSERLSVVIKRFIDPDKLQDVVSLIGPSHAEEVVKSMLTAVNAVCENDESCKIVQEAFSNENLRVYRNNDVIGAEIGVALKNIMAIGSGILQGVGQGDNAKAALITRGLKEMLRYGTFFGGQFDTFLGLDGVGDLVVTCTSIHSRNFQAGYKIGLDDSAEDFFKTNKKTVEGVNCVKVVYKVAKENNISMPITEQVYKVLFENKKPSIAMKELMARDLKSEHDY